MKQSAEPIGRPEANEAAPYYFRYIDRVSGDRPLVALEEQLDETWPILSRVTEEQSLYRYAEGKWSMRQVLNHVTDCERLFTFRAFWFARGFVDPLPAFEQDEASSCAGADGVSWSDHVDEFRQVRMATIALFENLPAEAWSRTGTASGYLVSVRALAFITAGHAAHHLGVLTERYLRNPQATR